MSNTDLGDREARSLRGGWGNGREIGTHRGGKTSTIKIMVKKVRFPQGVGVGEV